MDSVFINGMLAFLIAFAVFIGSVYLLVALILGPRLGYFVVATNLLGIIAMLALFWVGISLIPLPQLGLGTALGPKGAETTWHGIGAGPDVTSVEHEFGTFEV
ncbi:MAG TPA: hypothetical protein VND22_08285, partial [Actinomycetota bacterium]|nr:hypothetical protein [Actinomycetota bacterium]